MPEERDRQILQLNPWFTDPRAIQTDPHLQAMRRGPFVWDPPVMEDIDPRPGAVHTLRGPRQVGKTTTAKRLIERLLEGGERRVLYYSFDLEGEARAIAEIIQRAKEIAVRTAGPWYLFLDEVTAIPEWQRGVKFAWDHGLIRDDFVLCTGSSAHRMGTEQLPGRRGSGKNFLQMPVSFRDFCGAVRAITLPDETLTLAEWLTPEGRTLAKRLYLQLPALRDALDVYVRVGGFPAALRDYVTSGEVSLQTINGVWAMIANEVRVAGLDGAAALKLVERIGISLGSMLSWQAAAEAMDVGSHHTARSYVRALAESFTLLVIYYWSREGGFEPRKQRKIYFIDPLFASVPTAALGLSSHAPADGLLEGVMAATLFRSASDHLVQADPTIGALGYWRSRDGREIDFVADGGDPDLEVRIPVEVKGDSRSGIASAIASLRRTFARGLVTTRTRFEPDGDILIVPAAVLLAGLVERTERRMSTL